VNQDTLTSQFNTHTFQAIHLPFGGTKATGFGGAADAAAWLLKRGMKLWSISITS